MDQDVAWGIVIRGVEDELLLKIEERGLRGTLFGRHLVTSLTDRYETAASTQYSR